MSTYTVVGSGPDVPCSQSQRRHSEHVIIRDPDATRDVNPKCFTETASGGSAAAFYLQADGQVDPAAERRADRSRVKAEVFEELREGVRERHPGPLLRHHDAGPNPGQIQTASLDQRENLITQKTEGLLRVCLRVFINMYI